MHHLEVNFCSKWTYFKDIFIKKMAVFTLLRTPRIGVFLREKGLFSSISFRKRAFFSPICIYKTSISSILRVSKMGFFFEKIPSKGLFPSQNSPFLKVVYYGKVHFKLKYLINTLCFQDRKGKKVKILINQITYYYFKYTTMFISILYAP
jgi:hypothetical protein